MTPEIIIKEQLTEKNNLTIQTKSPSLFRTDSGVSIDQKTKKAPTKNPLPKIISPLAYKANHSNHYIHLLEHTVNNHTNEEEQYTQSPNETTLKENELKSWFSTSEFEQKLLEFGKEIKR